MEGRYHFPYSPYCFCKCPVILFGCIWFSADIVPKVVLNSHNLPLCIVIRCREFAS